jgi:2-polyprenyl-3-methyl-5-hydroxy-6-metoxy-1,4-benzoquinol methylase
MSALEFGCGTGLLSFALQRDFAAITLADTSQGMLDVLAAKIADGAVRNMHPCRLDAACSALAGSRFDVIYSLMTLHHIPDTAQTLTRFHGLLNPGGFLCIADLDEEDGSFHGADVTDVHRGFERRALQGQAEAAGFADVQFSAAFTVEKPVDGREKSFPVFLMLATKGVA